MENPEENSDALQIPLTVDTNLLNVQNSHSIWEEIRTANTHPSRRSYHSAVIWNDKMFIYGGQDLREGVQNGLWSIEIGQFDQGDWEECKVELKNLCRHSAIVKSDNMYIFGGTDGSQEYNETTLINLSTFCIRKVLPDNKAVPPPTDSHTAVLHENGPTSNMVIFGGYASGNRTSSVFLFNLLTEKWSHCSTNRGPEARSNHSSVIHRDSMYSFGGTNDEGEKLNDLWKLDLKTNTWQLVLGSGDVPSSRSGHSAVLYKSLIIIFGGMKDITKETNDMYTFDIESNIWVLCQFEHQIKDPVSNEQVEEFKKSRNSPIKPKDTGIKSPLKGPGEPSPKGKTCDSPKKKRTLYDGPASLMTGRVRSHPPHPRDGHSAVISQGTMIVFGGDRHQMPFNDTYIYFLVDRALRTPVKSS